MLEEVLQDRGRLKEAMMIQVWINGKRTKDSTETAARTMARFLKKHLPMLVVYELYEIGMLVIQTPN